MNTDIKAFVILIVSIVVLEVAGVGLIRFGRTTSQRLFYFIGIFNCIIGIFVLIVGTLSFAILLK
jgi:hypothetical protein